MPPDLEAAENAPAPVPSGNGHHDAAHDLTAILGQNLRRLRTRNGLSLERLAKLSGVSRAMLGQIEAGRSAPTISLLWKIATALSVPFSTLISTHSQGGTLVLRQDDAKILSSSGGKFTSRALFPYDGERRAEFYELRIAPRHIERAQPHAPGTRENIVVVQGTIEIRNTLERPHILSEGDAILFEADTAHSYRNLGSGEAVLYLVMTYVESIG